MPNSRPISFDHVAAEYDKTRRLPSPIEERVIETLGSFLGRERVLDAGVGTGRWAAPLASQGVPVVGVDVAPRMLAVASARGARDLLLGDVRRIPLRGRSVESVMSTHLLHLVPEWPNVLSEFARIGRTRYVSVLEYETEEPDLRQEYGGILAAQGVPIEAQGLSERDLRRRLVPDREVEVAKADRAAEFEEILGPLENRRFRYTWDTPEPLHRNAIAELRHRHAGSTVRNRLEVVVASWSIDRIRGFAETARTLPSDGPPVGRPDRSPPAEGG